MEEETNNKISKQNESNTLSEYNEWNWSLYEKTEFSSVNNGIKETLEFNIYNTNDFSFCEEDKDIISTPPTTNNSIRTIKNYNYKAMSQGKKKDNGDDKIEAMLRDVTEIKEYKLKQKGLFLGMFSKEDFELNSNNKLNNSFREEYQSPLNIDNEEEEEDVDKKTNNKKSEDEKIESNIVKEVNIKTQLARKEMESDKKKDEECFDDIDDIRNIILKNDIENKDKRIENLIKTEDIDDFNDINRNEKKNDNDINNNNMMMKMDNKIIKEDKENTREITKQESNISNKENNIRDRDIDREINNQSNELNNIKNFQREESKEEDKNDQLNKDSNPIGNRNKYNEHFEENPSHKDKNQDSLRKISELTEKLEKSECKYKIAHEKNNKLLEVIDIFKVLQSIDNKTSQNNNNQDLKNSKHNATKQAKSSDKIKGKSNLYYSSPDFGKLYIDYVQTNHKTYVQIYNKTLKKRHRKNNSKKHYEMDTLNRTYCKSSNINVYSSDKNYNPNHYSYPIRLNQTKVNYQSNLNSRPCSKGKRKYRSHSQLNNNHFLTRMNNQSYINIPQRIGSINNNNYADLNSKGMNTIDYNSSKEDNLYYHIDNNNNEFHSERNKMIKPQYNPVHYNDINNNTNHKTDNNTIPIESKLIDSSNNNSRSNNTNYIFKSNPYYNNRIEDDPYWNVGGNKISKSNKILKSSNTNDGHFIDNNMNNQSNTNSKHKLLDFNQFQAIFNENDTKAIDNKGVKAYKNNSIQEPPMSFQVKTSSSQDPQTDTLSPQMNNNNKNKLNQLQTPISSSNVISEQLRKFSPLSYQNYNEENYILPFYLLSKREITDNVVNYLFEKPKKLNITYYPKKRGKVQTMDY